MKVPYWLRSTLSYPSNLWRWPFVLLVRLPLFLICHGCRWIADTIDDHSHSIPALLYKDPHHDQ